MKFILLVFLIFTGHYLVAQQPKLVLPVGHPQGILQVISTPNGKYIISRSYNDLYARIWSTTTGNFVTEINTHTNEGISYMLPSKDNEHIFIAYKESGFYWNLFKNKAEISLHEPIKGASFSEEGDKMLYYNYHDVNIVNLKDSNVLFKLHVLDSISEVRYLRNDLVLVISKNKSELKFNFYNSSINNCLGEYKLNNIQEPECRFDEDAVGYKILANSGEKITAFTISKVTYEVLDSVKWKAFGFCKGISDFSQETGNYVIAYPDYKRLRVLMPKTKISYIRDEDYFTTNISHVSYVNNGKNIAVESYNNSNFDYYNDSLTFLQSYETSDSANFKNVFSSIHYNRQTNRFYVVLNDNFIREYQIKADTSKLSKLFSGKTGEINGVFKISDTLYFADGLGFLKTLNLNKGIVMNSFRLNNDYISSLKYNPNRGYLTSTSLDNQLKVWDLKNNKLLWKDQLKFVNSKDEYYNYPSCDISNNHILTSVGGFKYLDHSKSRSLIQLRDVETGKLVKSKKRNWSHRISFSEQGNEIIDINHVDSSVDILNLNFELIRKIQIPEWIHHAFQSNSKTFLITISEHTIYVHNYQTGKSLFSFPFDNSEAEKSWSISNDDSLLILNSKRGSIDIFDLFGKRKIGSFLIHTGNNVGSYFIEKRKFVTYSEDGYLKYWQIENDTIKELYSTVPFDGIDYATIIPSGYYQCTNAAAKLLHYVTNDLKVITFEQLDVKYNRPDKVLEAIGSTDTTLINSYKKAYYKRLKKLEIDTTSFEEGYSVPESNFKNRDDIEYEQKNEELKLVINGVDSTYILDRFNVWINEIPLYGKRGISIRNRKTNQLDTTITVRLSQGENLIETSIMNVNGTESYRMPLYVKYSPTNPVNEKVHFIGIGIDKFADSTYNLRYSVKDIRDLAKKLKEKYGENIEIDTLLNQHVTVDAIKALKKKLLTTSLNDKVIISYSGHGMLSKDFDYYLSTYSVNFNQPEENGLSYDDLESLLDSIPARNKLLLIDACHSGEVDKEDLMAMKESSDSLIKGARAYAYKDDEKHLGLKNSFELMQNLFVNVGKSTGATIISAAAGTQFALERNDLKNGVFTYCILDAMNTYPTMKVSELKKTVGEQVEKITKGLQKPTSRNETINSDWKVW